MYKLEYLHEQLKYQTNQLMFVDKLNSISESCYDDTDLIDAVSETMQSIEEVSREGRLNLVDKLKTNIASADKILSKNKEAALKVKPIGLSYNDYMTFLSDEEIKNLYKKAIAYFNKFNPDKASEEELRSFILDSNNNVQYKEVSKIFGKGKETWTVKDIIITNKSNKDITKEDISKAVKFLENYDQHLKKLQKDFNDMNNEYINYVRNGGLVSSNTKGDIAKLRKNAMNHKVSLVSIADSTYYTMLIEKARLEFNQAKRIVVKAANYNPRNLKESYKIQDYIDALYDFHENC